MRLLRVFTTTVFFDEEDNRNPDVGIIFVDEQPKTDNNGTQVCDGCKTIYNDKNFHHCAICGHLLPCIEAGNFKPTDPDALIALEAIANGDDDAQQTARGALDSIASKAVQ